MDKGKREGGLGTAWNLHLVKGDLVEIVSEYQEDLPLVDVRETKTAIVLEGPETEEDGTKVLYVPDRQMIFNKVPYTGKPEERWSGFENFRRLMPAKEVL